MSKKKTQESKMTPFELVRNSSIMELYDALDEDEMAEDMLSDIVKSATDFIKSEQHTALELTRLIIENSDDKTENNIFDVFKRAVHEVKLMYLIPGNGR